MKDEDNINTVRRKKVKTKIEREAVGGRRWKYVAAIAALIQKVHHFFLYMHRLMSNRALVKFELFFLIIFLAPLNNKQCIKLQ